MLTLEDRAEPLDLDPGLEAGRVDLLGLRDVEHVHAGVLGELGVAGLVARVAGQVLAFRELGRVDEQAGDHELVLLARGPEEREVALVEGAHRRHQPELAMAGKLVGAAGDPHRAVASASTS